MAKNNAGGRALEKSQSSLVFREVVPPHSWWEDASNHYLRLTLVGFETKDIAIHLDKYGHLIVRGERKVTEHKYICFEESFDIPKDSDIEEASGDFEDDQTYCITIPKKGNVKKENESGHVIRMPKDKPEPVKEDTSMRPLEELPELKEKSLPKSDSSRQKLPKQPSSNDPLGVISKCKSKKTIGLVVAVLVVIIIICSSAIAVKLRK